MMTITIQDLTIIVIKKDGVEAMYLQITSYIQMAIAKTKNVMGCDGYVDDRGFYTFM